MTVGFLSKVFIVYSQPLKFAKHDVFDGRPKNRVPLFIRFWDREPAAQASTRNMIELTSFVRNKNLTNCHLILR